MSLKFARYRRNKIDYHKEKNTFITNYESALLYLKLGLTIISRNTSDTNIFVGQYEKPNFTSNSNSNPNRLLTKTHLKISIASTLIILTGRENKRKSNSYLPINHTRFYS